VITITREDLESVRKRLKFLKEMSNVRQFTNELEELNPDILDAVTEYEEAAQEALAKIDAILKEKE